MICNFSVIIIQVKTIWKSRTFRKCNSETYKSTNIRNTSLKHSDANVTLRCQCNIFLKEKKKSIFKLIPEITGNNKYFQILPISL